MTKLNLNRKKIKKKELLKRINKILVNHHPECRNIIITDNHISIGNYQDDVNWDISWARQSGIDNNWVECKKKIRFEIDNLRLRFDVIL